MLLYSRDEWFWIIMMPLASVQISVSRDFEGILQFWTARILKFQIKWFWCSTFITAECSLRFSRLGIRILLQDRPLKSAQISKNDIQFAGNFYVSYSWWEHVCSNTNNTTTTTNNNNNNNFTSYEHFYFLIETSIFII